VTDLDRVRLQLDRIRGAVEAIDPVFLDTPALPCAPLDEALGCSVTLKLETLNPVRSFKGRGTETAAASARGQGASRMVCASAGNLGQALAYSGSRRGLDVTVVAGSTANPLKLRQIAALGAHIQLDGEDIEHARVRAREIAQADGAYLVEDSLDLATCEGAATIGLELVRDDSELDVVLIALGGGAMASGVGYVMRALAHHAEVIGIQPTGAPAMALSWRQGEVVETDRIETIADGVAGRCPIPEVLDDLLVVLDDVVLVGEDSIKAGMRALCEHAGLVVEPSGALGIAALLGTRSGSRDDASPRSCAEATWPRPTSRAGCWSLDERVRARDPGRPAPARAPRALQPDDEVTVIPVSDVDRSKRFYASSSASTSTGTTAPVTRSAWSS
jgi:threonine dehydratase